MTLIKISMPDAIRIEKARRDGVEIGELLKHENFASLGTDLETVFRDGYQVKFLTVNGAKNLLRIKFGQEADLDYTETEQGLSGLALDEAQAESFRQILSDNCRLEQEAGGSYRVIWA
ncbi:hypothetical protein BBI15_09950 [Planococcus plakortidis]|uniref:Uncharacterized protein n=1 Tax=Planococcus plakortidis TaxID=1038856 RepID=A0A1C7EA13_9BACL|nr:hypothetical protein [Planococcus plakortidis]ANU20515.1 hypothetical protein BBI15_09950 [Planococcus plakortidis]